MTWHRSKLWHRYPIWRRASITWRVLRLGLPRIEVEYIKEEHDDGTKTLTTWFQYPGEVHTVVERRHHTSIDGTFEIIQKLEDVNAGPTDS